MSGYTYRQAAYLVSFTANLESIIKDNPVLEAFTTVKEYMLYCNFNDLGFINYLFQNLKKEVAGIDGLGDQAVRWYHYLKEYSQYMHLDGALHWGQPSVTTSICSRIKKELACIRYERQWQSQGTP